MQSSVKTNIRAANEDTTSATISPPDNPFPAAGIVIEYLIQKGNLSGSDTVESVCEHS